MANFAIDEMAKIGFIHREDVLDYTVIKVPKTYPAYFGTYSEFDKVRAYLDKFDNLYLIGRNGMHRYNNQDHSMLTAIAAVDNIRHGVTDKSNIWDINTEQDYHETKSDSNTTAVQPKARGLVSKPARKLIEQFVGYLFTGGAATVLDVIVFSILVNSGLWPTTALGISFLFGVSANFWLSRRYVFRVYWRNTLAQYTVFTIVAINTLLANLGLMELLIKELGWSPIHARVVSAACVALISFIGHKLNSFSTNQQAEEQVDNS